MLNMRQLPWGDETALHLLAELGHVVQSYGSQELNVVVTVIFGHLLCCGFVWSLTRE